MKGKMIMAIKRIVLVLEMLLLILLISPLFMYFLFKSSYCIQKASIFYTFCVVLTAIITVIVSITHYHFHKLLLVLISFLFFVSNLYVYTNHLSNSLQITEGVMLFILSVHIFASKNELLHKVKGTILCIIALTIIGTSVIYLLIPEPKVFISYSPDKQYRVVIEVGEQGAFPKDTVLTFYDNSYKAKSLLFGQIQRPPIKYEYVYLDPDFLFETQFRWIDINHFHIGDVTINLGIQ